MTLPPLHDGPIGETGVNLDGHGAPGCDLLGRAEGSLLRRGPNGDYRPRPQVSPDTSGLLQTVGGQVESRHGPAHEMVGVVGFGVSDEVHQCGHTGRSLARVDRYLR